MWKSVTTWTANAGRFRSGRGRARRIASSRSVNALWRGWENICASRGPGWLSSGRAQRRSRPTVHAMIYLYSEVLMLAIRLPQSIEKRLEKLARRTGRTKTYYVREAIIEHLDDLEDLYLAERTLDRIRSGEEQTIPLEDALKRHGLED